MDNTDNGLVERFWLSLREPGCVPVRKGPWSTDKTAEILREVIAARPTAYIDYIWLDSLGEPQIEHGPEVLQMQDGRSMSVGRKHNQRVREAATCITELEAQVERLTEERDGAYERAAQVAENWDCEDDPNALGLDYHDTRIDDAGSFIAAAIRALAQADGNTGDGE